MKWLWGWKGAAIALVLWVVYVFLTLGLGGLADTASRSSLTIRPLDAVHRGLAVPGEAMVNAVWDHIGRRLYPSILQRVPIGHSGGWTLDPVGYLAWPDPPDGVRFLGFVTGVLVRPTPLEFLVHVLLLPGLAAAMGGFVVGSIGGLVAGPWGAREQGQG